MAFKIAVVDDDPKYTSTVLEYIATFSKQTGLEFETICFSDGEEIVTDYESFDIIFLDIQMTNLDGLKTAQRIRELDADVFIVFITNAPQYAIKGYSVRAFNYLLKPVTQFAFTEQLKKCIQQINQRCNAFVLCRTESGTIRLSAASILFVESFNHKMSIVTSTNEYSMSISMKELEKKLPKQHFFRCHKSFLVNLAHVSAIKDNDITVEKHTIPVGRNKRKLFLEALTNYNL